MKASAKFVVRGIGEFSETETPDDWLSVYGQTKTVEELLGLLHEGPRYIEDERVLKVYYDYAALTTKSNKIVQKARSVFFHKILDRFVDADGEHFDVRKHSEEYLCGLEKIFQFFMEPERFPVEQPFQNDVYEFLEKYAKKLSYAAGTTGGGVPIELWKTYMEVLLIGIESESGERYDKLVRDVIRNGWDPVRKSFAPVLTSRLQLHEDRRVRKTRTEPIKTRTEQELCENGIRHGGGIRREALILLDMRSTERPFGHF